jgi:hypothetical protein
MAGFREQKSLGLGSVRFCWVLLGDVIALIGRKSRAIFHLREHPPQQIVRRRRHHRLRAFGRDEAGNAEFPLPHRRRLRDRGNAAVRVIAVPLRNRIIGRRRGRRIARDKADAERSVIIPAAIAKAVKAREGAGGCEEGGG